MSVKDTWLPLGSVVLLRQGAIAATIAGYMMQGETGEGRDYVGIPHPQGWTGPESVLAFDWADIDQVLYIGYRDLDGDRFCERLARHDEAWRALRGTERKEGR